MATDVTTSTVVSYTAFPPLRWQYVRPADSKCKHFSLRGIRRMPRTRYDNYHASMKLLYLLPATRLIANAVYFCCTVPGVASARRYLASCPVKPGLSSPMPFRLHGSDHLSYSVLYNTIKSIFYNNFCNTKLKAI